ncbi:MAG: RidA family protein [Candidatus Bipolaricaulis sp.]|jgi:enamine deaminase RidA (YjgF/YER057c/UK114 family)|nr:RidA family protein [Candidatus Bipolaricaulis sp.]MDD5220478.1 RidA family protein [Candidatus Bipolaricaulis sp.]MDD5646577.1 RidA family protein [Candidatus Bipolaricaulis sp.]
MNGVSAERRLAELGLELPPPPAPGGEYVAAKKVGRLLFLSGQGPMRNGVPTVVGQVGRDVSLEQGVEAARQATLNALAAIRAATGSLDNVEEIVQLRGFVNSAPGFDRQPQVMNGASKLLVSVFGEAGRHVRCALGTSSLPHNIPVELEMIVSLRQEFGAQASPAEDS